ncbi:MAG: citrate transporter [Bacteroidetes bacterium GWF2_49_14]|nr:MAG: citrate transporter [Bacteroidetes bacterium GWF2_49_14]
MSFAAAGGEVPTLGPVRIEFILFAITLICVAVFHHKTMQVALVGLAVVLAFKLIFDPSFNIVEHIIGGDDHEGEWRVLLNLLGLLFGFAILAKHFAESRVPEILPNYLPNNWTGGLVLLFLVMILSSFLDNIAAAMIGGTMAMVLYKGKVHLGFLAAIVAASNAGGAGSVVGDTTTTLMWIDGVEPVWVLEAFVASAASFLIFGFFGARQQHKHQPILKDNAPGIRVDKGKLFIVFLILVGAISTNYLLDFPAAGVWIAIFIGALIRKTPWNEMKHAWKGTVFLMSLVTIASMMPVDDLPPASWVTTFSLGFVSAVFDNIPLTKLCLEQGGYDWGILAYAVGFGGSMIWFGSSAGVALSNIYPEAKNTVNYIKKGWHVALSYVVGFFVMLGVVGWHPHEPYKKSHQSANTEISKK